MIAAVTGREVPPPPGLPIDVGAVVCNVSTTVAVYDAVQKNKPLIERVVTVTGRQMEAPKNLLVRFGTPVAVLLEAAGGVPAGECESAQRRADDGTGDEQPRLTGGQRLFGYYGARGGRQPCVVGRAPVSNAPNACRPARWDWSLI